MSRPDHYLRTPGEGPYGAPGEWGLPEQQADRHAFDARNSSTRTEERLARTLAWIADLEPANGNALVHDRSAVARAASAEAREALTGSRRDAT